jgi:hypothetical protein
LAQVEDDIRKQKIATAIKWGAGLGVGFLASFIIVHAIAGLIGLVIAGAIGLTVVHLAPVFAMKLANFSMKLMLNEAEKNPIESMLNIYQDNMRIIGEKDQKIAQFQARMEDFKTKMNYYAAKYPTEVSQYQMAEQKMELVLARQKQKQKIAKQEAKLYHDQIDKGKAIYDMACAAHACTELAGSLEKKAFQDIIKQVSFDSITHKFNVAVSELSVEADTDPDSIMMSVSEPAQLPESTGSSTISIPADTREKVRSQTR